VWSRFLWPGSRVALVFRGDFTPCAVRVHSLTGTIQVPERSGVSPVQPRTRLGVSGGALPELSGMQHRCLSGTGAWCPQAVGVRRCFRDSANGKEAESTSTNPMTFVPCQLLPSRLVWSNSVVGKKASRGLFCQQANWSAPNLFSSIDGNQRRGLSLRYTTCHSQGMNPGPYSGVGGCHPVKQQGQPAMHRVIAVRVPVFVSCVTCRLIPPLSSHCVHAFRETPVMMTTT
jgi:hypothetical protein